MNVAFLGVIFATTATCLRPNAVTVSSFGVSMQYADSDRLTPAMPPVAQITPLMAKTVESVQVSRHSYANHMRSAIECDTQVNMWHSWL